MDVHVGDRVQIKTGARDISSGRTASNSAPYTDGSSTWAVVDLIDNDYHTQNRYGLPGVVTRIRCLQPNSGVVVWQVQPDDLCNVISSAYSNESEEGRDRPHNYLKVEVEDDERGKRERPHNYLKVELEDDTQVLDDNRTAIEKSPSPDMRYGYAITDSSDTWGGGLTSQQLTTGTLPVTAGVTTIGAGSDAMDIPPKHITNNPIGGWRPLTNVEKRNIGNPSNIVFDESVVDTFNRDLAWDDTDKRRQMLNNDVENIQNSAGFPYQMAEGKGGKTAKYDYRIRTNGDKYPIADKLEDKLKTVRASLGLQVHGNNGIARAVKYYMYNRYKVPDTNLAHNKSFTHIFFTRPDLNLLTYGAGQSCTANDQTLRHTDSAMIWRTHPDLFKLLTHAWRCGDGNNFNMLLSQQVTSFDIADETLSVNEAGKSYGEYSMQYGDSYTGRAAGEFRCNFVETSDYSVINLIKLWITYIANVGNGMWSPSYNLRGAGGVSTSDPGASHVYTKTLDYAASAYVFKCGGEGNDVLYWTKYYGIFPTNTGASALSWDSSKSIGDTPNLGITFKYSAKKDMSPISLLEFNHNAMIGSRNEPIYETEFNWNYGHVSRPFVGTPYIEIDLGEPTTRGGGVNFSQKETHIRLRFTKSIDAVLTDDLLYKTHIGI